MPADPHAPHAHAALTPANNYRKKPVVIEAFKLFTDPIPDWFMDRVTANTCILHRPTHADIVTLEGTMRADAGDWIIQGIKGELYPCKPDIFEATYEPAASPPAEAPQEVPVCSGCGREIDLDWCWCGSARDDHDMGSSHGFVAMGCGCSRARSNAASPPSPQPAQGRAEAPRGEDWQIIYDQGIRDGMPEDVASIRATAILAASPAPAPSASEVERLADDDLCRLSIVFNRGAHLGRSQDYRINEWLKEQIRLSRVLRGEGAG